MCRTRWSLLFALIAAAWASDARSQDRPPILQSIDVQIPRAPERVRIDGQDHLVYELHFTNFLPVDVSLVRIEVKGEPAQAPLAEYRDEALRRILGRPGLRGAPVLPIGPGSRAVAFFWIALPDAAAPPGEIRHRIELDALRPSGAVRVTVEPAASTVSAEPPVTLGPPLRGGPWVAIYEPLLIGGHRTAFYTLDGRARIPGRFAIDFVRLAANGTLDTTLPRRSDWNGQGAEVFAVTDAIVAAAMDDIADNTGEPGASAHAPENASGNYVALDLGLGRFAFYEHLQHGSVAVQVGQRVRRGQVIGRLGNSGSSSMGPHLHFHLADASSPLGAEGIPFVFGSFEHLGGFGSINALLGGERWAGESRGERKLERPAPNAVVRFP